jgi:hypothetical protein
LDGHEEQPGLDDPSRRSFMATFSIVVGRARLPAGGVNFGAGSVVRGMDRVAPARSEAQGGSVAHGRGFRFGRFR